MHDFKIYIFDKNLSDTHNALCLSLKVLNKPGYIIAEEMTTQNIVNENDVYIRWSSDKVEDLRNAINLNRIEDVMKYLNDIDNDVVHQDVLDTIIDDICSVFSDSAKDTGIMKFKKNVKYKKRRICENKPWYNEECEVKRKLYFAARNNYSVDKSERSRHIMVNLNKDYKKCLKRAYRVYKVEFNRNLRSIRNTNPKEYWNILNDKKKHEDIPFSKEQLLNIVEQI